ncbi:hypothetical protein IV203_032254 [Nitzschia inconspicua]|uniref:Uncharacterized protein n=1 Tax=Nitzschia inconspicua TaxID=303405 RepID=A0A9K3KJA7_9STRA|nr:hypothetical protein IV203_032254 [Nitzschia inconspicua]
MMMSLLRFLSYSRSSSFSVAIGTLFGLVLALIPVATYSFILKGGTSRDIPFKTQKLRLQKLQAAATSASAAYLESLSDSSLHQQDALLGATSKYLHSLSNHILAWEEAIFTTGGPQSNHQDVSTLQEPIVWSTAEMLQQAADDLTRALVQMTNSNHDWSSLSSTLLAADVQYIWDIDDTIVEKKGRMIPNQPSFQQLSSSSTVHLQDTLNQLSNSINDMVNQLTTETAKAATTAANAAKTIQPPSFPQIPPLPLHWRVSLKVPIRYQHKFLNLYKLPSNLPLNSSNKSVNPARRL